MTAPAIYGHPIKRPVGFLFNARFEGEDEALYFIADFPNIVGAPQQISFRLFNDGNSYQQMCIPTAAYDIEKIDDDALIASLRMASIISCTAPTSQEWKDAMTVEGDGNTKFFQTAVGQTRMSDSALNGDALIDVTFQRGTTTNRKTVSIGYREISQEEYVYSPQTQLQIIAGSVLKQFPSGYKHDYPNGDILTAQERQDIIDYVNALTPWV